jgi:pimeloyl-ACP methyl ester carboxylesterase
MEKAESPPSEPQECWATIEGHRMRYLRCGAGPPVLLIHGLLGFSFSWRFALPALAPHFTCYAVDLLGMGHSERVPDLPVDFNSQARRMAQFMDALGVASADVIGTSYGGAVAMTLAAQTPECVRRLVLVAPANPWSKIGSVLAAIIATRIGRCVFLRFAPRWNEAAKARMARMYGDPSRMPPDSFPTYSAAAAVPGTLEQVARMMCSWQHDLSALKRSLPRIANIPTLLIWGSRDRIVDPRSAVRLKAAFTNAKLIMMDGLGHLPYEEAPEEFNRVLLEFLI